MLTFDVMPLNERVHLSGRDKCPLQPPKATKNFIFRELQGIYMLTCKHIYKKTNLKAPLVSI